MKFNQEATRTKIAQCLFAQFSDATTLAEVQAALSSPQTMPKKVFDQMGRVRVALQVVGASSQEIALLDEITEACPWPMRLRTNILKALAAGVAIATGKKDGSEIIGMLEAPATITKDVYAGLQQQAEWMAMDRAQGQDAVDGFDEKQKLLDEIMEASPWTMHPDYGQIAKSVLTEIESPLPPWATGHAKSFTDAGAQLCTKDGRRMGNAILLGKDVSPAFGREVFNVVTDVGNVVRFTEAELQEQFYEPRFTMDIDTHPGVAIMKAPTGQEVKGQLAGIASKIMAHASQDARGSTAVVAVNVQCVVNLGFDQGEEITAERLNLALAQTFMRNATDQGDDLQVDGAELIELIHE